MAKEKILKKDGKSFRTHIPYDAEERYSFFVERKIVTPRPYASKKDYKRSRDKKVSW